jgi:hypothetical protein
MVVKPPNRNLSPESTPWGRWVETLLENVQNTFNQQAQALTNSLKAINGSLKALGDQQTKLAATQTTLANQQIQMNTSYYSETLQSGGFTIPASGSGAGTGHTFTVPAGFNRMQLTYIFNVIVSTTTSDMIVADYNIAGSISGTFQSIVGQGTVQTPRTDFTRTAGYTGPVVPGESILVVPYIYNQSAGAKTGAFLGSVVNVSYYIA